MKKTPKQVRKTKKLKTGMPPGTLVFTGEQLVEVPEITVHRFGELSCEVTTYNNTQELIKFLSTKPSIQQPHPSLFWINIDGLHDVTLIETFCKFLDVHKLTIEDILSVQQRPKVEEHTSYLYIVARMFHLNPADKTIESEQVSFIQKDNLLITFQEKPGDVFASIRKRLNDGTGFVRRRGLDYLLYALLDSIVDFYFTVLDEVSQRLDDLEDLLLDGTPKNLLHSLHGMRKELTGIRRQIYPMRDVVSRLAKLGPHIITEPNLIFLRDLQDHSIRAIEATESLRDNAVGLLDLYMNSVSQKMNEVMKVLTIIATIFIPLTFIAGVYGMNFEHMPELSWRYAYLYIWIIMIGILVTMLLIFRNKKWI
jgi:magnesium transporter